MLGPSMTITLYQRDVNVDDKHDINGDASQNSHANMPRQIDIFSRRDA